jgi:hypothetical protein
MRTYTIHVRNSLLHSEPDVLVIRESFSWFAFLFSVFWALWNRLWLVALGLAFLEILLTASTTYIGVDAISTAIISLGLAVIIGFTGNDLKRWTLAGRAYVPEGIVLAPDADSALQRYLTAGPSARRNPDQ